MAVSTGLLGVATDTGAAVVDVSRGAYGDEVGNAASKVRGLQLRCLPCWLAEPPTPRRSHHSHSCRHIAVAVGSRVAFDRGFRHGGFPPLRRSLSAPILAGCQQVSDSVINVTAAAMNVSHIVSGSHAITVMASGDTRGGGVHIRGVGVSRPSRPNVGALQSPLYMA